MAARNLLPYLLGMGIALLAIIATDHVIARHRASDLCESFRTGMDAREVGAVMRLLNQKAGVLKVRGDPARMVPPLVRPAGRRDEFMQFSVVFEGYFHTTRQCVVSVKAGKVESARVMDGEAYILSNPVQTVRVRN